MHVMYTMHIHTNCLLLRDSPGQRAFIKHLLLSQVDVLENTEGE